MLGFIKHIGQLPDFSYVRFLAQHQFPFSSKSRPLFPMAVLKTCAKIEWESTGDRNFQEGAYAWYRFSWRPNTQLVCSYWPKGCAFPFPFAGEHVFYTGEVKKQFFQAGVEGRSLLLFKASSLFIGVWALTECFHTKTCLVKRSGKSSPR